MSAATLPAPSPEGVAHSARVARRIAGEIRAAGGCISFARYMELALHAPGLGYYSAGAAKFGAAGDFVTAPELSPLFGRTLARGIAQLPAFAGRRILEIGAGTGRLAVDVLGELARLGTPVEGYGILETSAELRERQGACLAREAARELARVSWLDRLPETFSGVVIGNEVLDAMPVHLVRWCGDELFERGVALQDQRFVWREWPLVAGPLRDTAARLAPGGDYLSEVSLAIPAFIASLAQCLAAGAAIFIDYGFRRAEYYHPQRRRGTLMCHYRHHSHDEPFHLPGLQDITAHVNFDGVIEAAEAAGMMVSAYSTQARYLLDHGVLDLLAETDPRDAARYLPLANQAQRLLSPAEMGELFKVIVLEKG